MSMKSDLIKNYANQDPPDEADMIDEMVDRVPEDDLRTELTMAWTTSALFTSPILKAARVLAVPGSELAKLFADYDRNNAMLTAAHVERERERESGPGW